MAYTPQTTGVITTPKQYNTSPVGYDPAYGGIPTLPAYTTDTTQMAGTDVEAQLIANLPNYRAMVEQATGNIGANLRGEVAPDVAYNLGTQAAEYGVGSGSPMSRAATTNFLARYGLTSDALQARGQQQLLAQMQATPIQQTQTGQTITDLAAQQAVYNAAPTPSAAAAASLAAAQGGINAGRGSVAPTYPTQGSGAQSLIAPSSRPTFNNSYPAGGWYYGTNIAPTATPTQTAAAWNPYAGGDWTIDYDWGTYVGSPGFTDDLFSDLNAPAANSWEADMAENAPWYYFD
jgi:hypothetical protein